MLVKKKNLGIKMVVSLLFLLLSLFAYSTCFCASLTPINSMTLEQAQNFEVWLETIFEGQDLSAEQIRTAWNNFSFDLNVEYLENIVFFRSKYSSGKPAVRAIYTNNTISNSLNNVTIPVTSSTPSGLYLKYRTTLNSEDITITKSVNLTCEENILSLSFISKTDINTSNSGYFFLNGTTLNYNDDLSILISTEINTFCKTPALYVKPYGTSTYYVMGLSQNMAVEEETGGDTGGEGGEDTGGGSTTTPDYSEELDNIQTGIGNINENLENIEDKIPTGEEIKDAEVEGNKEYWGEDIDNEQAGNDLDNIISGVQDDLSETLSSSEIFGALESAEQGFFDVISGEAKDFKISWNDVEYMGQVLIPKGEINFSQMCRDNEVLGSVKNYINIISSFFMSIAIFKYVYNLFLSTLGIDNPYLYEQPENNMTMTYDINNGTRTYRGTTTDGNKFIYRTGGKKK